MAPHGWVGSFKADTMQGSSIVPPVDFSFLKLPYNLSRFI